MKTAEVNKTDFKTPYPVLEEVSAWIDVHGKRLPINTINWEEYNYKPEVTLAIAYSENEIYLKYYVTEDYFKAEKTETNQMVCEDSCVEFFVSPEDDGIYYNIEFNGIGTCLMGAGTGRSDRKQANPMVVSSIRRLSSIGRKPVKEIEGQFEWAITVAIPLEAFFHHKIKELKGKTVMANFYKCGDMLKVPHYVTWNPVGTATPDYHQPKFFGELKFV